MQITLIDLINMRLNLYANYKQIIYKAGICNSGVVYSSPSSSLQTRFNTLGHPFLGRLKAALRGSRFEDDDELKTAPEIQQNLKVIVLERFTRRCERCTDNEGDFVENNLNFVQDVNMINVNFITIAFTVL